eukprot:TRINITY_DN15606_c0_g1_i1.p1 TRINITY_DN15606_c0_g1~~TRINITY_DN15606_c0_g1_i1.p1  ORF type:complete len:179 (+),score=8.56 TRINITY_DN15606_c0_g1_i1:80-616(+)
MPMAPGDPVKHKAPGAIVCRDRSESARREGCTCGWFCNGPELQHLRGCPLREPGCRADLGRSESYAAGSRAADQPLSPQVEYRLCRVTEWWNVDPETVSLGPAELDRTQKGSQHQQHLRMLGDGGTGSDTSRLQAGESSRKTPETSGGHQRASSPCSCLLYTSPSPRDRTRYRMPSSA